MEKSNLRKRIHFAPLTPGFVVAKPLQWGAYDEKELYDLEKQGRLIITRKRDGFKLYVVKAKGQIFIYTSGVNEVDERLTHLRQELVSLNLPDRTILVGEGIADREGNDEFTLVESLFKSSTEVSLQKQRDTTPLSFMVFNVVFWNGNDLSSRSNAYRLKKVAQILSGQNLRHIVPLTVLETTYDKAKEVAVKNGWEGLVLYDALAVSSYRLDGKSPERPDGCYKWKPLYEDDFIVREFIPSPTDPNRLREIVLLQIDPETGREFYCGKLGTFTAKMRQTLREAAYPLVVQAEFEARYASGALRNARFLRLRSDKPVRDCLAPKHFPKAKEK